MKHLRRLLFHLLQAVSTISTQEAAFIKRLPHSGCTPDTSSPILASTLLGANCLRFTDRNQGSLEGDSVPGQRTAKTVAGRALCQHGPWNQPSSLTEEFLGHLSYFRNVFFPKEPKSFFLSPQTYKNLTYHLSVPIPLKQKVQNFVLFDSNESIPVTKDISQHQQKMCNYPF